MNQESSVNIYTIIKTILESEEDIAFEKSQSFALISVTEDFIRSRIPTFQFSNASKSALTDFMDSEGMGYCLNFLNSLKAHKKYMLPGICIVLVASDFKRAQTEMKKENGNTSDSGTAGVRENLFVKGVAHEVPEEESNSDNDGQHPDSVHH